MVWQAALAGITQIGGSLLGMNAERKREKRAYALAMEQRAYEEKREANQFVRLRAAAEKGGFNPSAVLGATGGSGFSQHHSPVLSLASTGGYIEGMMQGIGGMFSAAYDRDPLQDRRAELEIAVMEAELRNINRLGQTPGFGQNPRATASRYTTQGPALANTPYEAGRRTQTWYAAPGSSWENHPSRPDAEVVETSLGEPAAWLYSPIAAGLDVGHNLRRARDFVRNSWAIRHGGPDRPVWVAPAGHSRPNRTINNRLDTYTGW
jgi:hypothetical protein